MGLRTQNLARHMLTPHVVTPITAAVKAAANAAPEPYTLTVNITASLTATKAVAWTIEGTPLEVAHKMAVPIITPSKTETPLFSLAVLHSALMPGDSVVALDALSGAQLVVLDFDDITQKQVHAVEAALRASNFVFLMYPTRSWTAGAPKWRVVVFLSRVAPVSQYEALWAGLGQLVGNSGDPTAKQVTRRFFVYSLPDGDQSHRPAPIVGGSRAVDPDELAALAPADAPPAAEVAVQRINTDALMGKRPDNRNRDAGLMAKHCPMVRAVRDGEYVPDGEWILVAGLLKFCNDGEATWHEWSAKDSRYGQQQAQKKYDDRPDALAPARCGQSLKCPGCKHNGKISSPIQLGDLPENAELKPRQENVQVMQDTLLADGVKAVVDPNGQLYFVETTLVDGRSVRTVLPATSVAGKDLLITRLASHGKAPSDKAIETLCAKLRYEARQRGETVKIHLRVAEVEGVTYEDLGPGRISRVGPDGHTLLDDTAEGVPLFFRGAAAGQLAAPQLFDSPRAALRFLIRILSDMFGLTPKQALIVVIVLLEWRRPSTPYPALELVGGAGSGKTTFAEFVAMQVDPSADGSRRTVGTAAPDLAAACQQRHLLVLDNVSQLDKATSNTLCIVSTGGTLLVRLYYAQSETANLTLHRPVVITAVSPVATAADLQTRVVRIELSARRTGFVAEGELRSNWAALSPRFQGALCTLLAGALRELPAVRAIGEWSHRLVDFDQLGEAAVRSAGLKPGTFLTAIGEMRASMARRTASGDLFLIAVLKVLRTLSSKPTHAARQSLGAVMASTPALEVVAHEDDSIEIHARPSAMHRLFPLPNLGFVRDTAIPATDRGLIDALRRVQPLLSGIGIESSEVAYGSKTLLRFRFAAEALVDD